MKLSGWGRYPTIETEKLRFADDRALKQAWRETAHGIAFGNGRSYGDSALGATVAPMRRLDHFIDFDTDSGVLTCEAGVLLADIIEVFVPRGWFLPVTPGTKFITVGGAVAADVHGKNHHCAGCFSAFVDWLELMLADGSVVRIGPEQDTALFRATCGGMGLTGIILRVAFRLQRIPSATLAQTTIKARNLAEAFEAFESRAEASYSVAWIDCLQTGERLGRSLVMTGEFVDDAPLSLPPERMRNVPVDFPPGVLNRASVRAFNAWYYGRAGAGVTQQRVGLNAFFYPLDALGHWNRIYGRAGFVQYQCILPRHRSYEGLWQILQLIADSGRGSFLAVLKLHGPHNDNYLSFPLEGYSLALDFPLAPGVFPLLTRVDDMVVEHGGRVYLAKDARLSRQAFEQGYPQLDAFRAVRERVDPERRFRSLQSERLGL